MNSRKQNRMMKRTNVLHALLILVLFTSLPLLCGGETALEKGFRNPPEDAKPWTWYHWVDGNVSREGIRADLQAMKKAGIGGFIVFDVSLRMPRGKIRTLSKEWYELIRYTIETAAELGLKVGFHNCPGWSTSGGPWVRPEDGMKELLITDVRLEVQEIARMTGFSDTSHFIAVFKKIAGVTPLEFRKLNRTV